MFPTSALAGFYAGGEIGPQALAQASGAVATQTGGATLQGFTAVFGLFSVPAATAARRPAAQLPSTLDATPAGLAAYLQTRPAPRPLHPLLSQAAPAAAFAAAEGTGAGGRADAGVAGDAGDGGEAVPTADEIAAMPVAALKLLIARARLSHGDCVEKAELRARAHEAARALGQRQHRRRANTPTPRAL